MPRHATITLLAVLAAACVLVAWLRSGDEAPPAPPPLAAQRDGGTVDGRLAELAPPTTAPTRAQVDAEPAADEPAEPPAGGDPVGLPGPRVTVEVVRAGDGAPIPFADVAIMRRQFDWDGMAPDEKRDAERLETFAMFLRFGELQRADRDGRLSLVIDRWLFLAGRGDGAFGTLYLEADGTDLAAVQRLELRRDLTVGVRVVGDDDRPVAEVSIGISPLWDDPAMDAVEQRNHTSIRAITDGRGEAELSHLQDWIALFAEHPPMDRIAVQPRIPGLDVAAQELDPRALPADPLTFRIPATGSVTVRVLDLDGAPIGTYEDVSLRVRGDHRGRASWGGESAGPGAARFLHVALGRTMVARASGLVDVPDVEFAGPTAPGEEVEVSLRAEAEGPVLRGRIVDADGAPEPGAYLLHYRTRGEDWWASYRQPTDEQGRIRIELDADLAGAHIELAALQQHVRYRPTTRVALLDLPAPLPAGLVPLGDVRLDDAPLLVAGRVLVDGAEPDVAFEVEVRRTAPGGSAGGAPRVYGIEVGPDGTFAARGLIEPGRYTVRAHSPDCLPSPAVPFVPGQRAVELTLLRGAAVRASVLLDDVALADLLHVELVPRGVDSGDLTEPDTDRGRRRRWGTRTDTAPAEFRWAGLRDGSYDLVVRCWSFARPLAVVEGVRVLAGAEPDPRLRGIDLRGGLQRTELVVRGPTGEPIRRGIVWPAGGDVPAEAIRIADGIARWVSAGPVDVRVAAPGLCPQTLHGVLGDVDVRLEALAAVHLRLPARPELASEIEAVVHANRHPPGAANPEVLVRGGNGDEARPERLVRYSIPARHAFVLGPRPQTVEIEIGDGELPLVLALHRGEQTIDVAGLIPSSIGPPAPAAPVTVRLPDAGRIAAAAAQLGR